MFTTRIRTSTTLLAALALTFLLLVAGCRTDAPASQTSAEPAQSTLVLQLHY